MKNKKALGSFDDLVLGLYFILLFSIVLFFLLIISSASNLQNTCEEIQGCAKLKCEAEDISLHNARAVKLLEYQNCLFE